MSADGNWKITVNSPMGVQEATLEIKTSGDTFTGKQVGRQGAMDISGKVAGNKLTWANKITQPMPLDLTYDVTVDGDKLTGTVTAGSFGSSPLTGVRA